MRHGKRIAAGLLAAAAAAVLLTVPAFAEGTPEDIYQAMEDICMPAGMIQDVRNNFKNSDYDENGMVMNNEYHTYTEWAELIRQKGVEYVWSVIAAEYGVSPEDMAKYREKQEAGEQETEPYTPSVRPEKPFAEMTAEEKHAYIDSLPEAERAQFLASLSPEERKSLIRQLDPEQQREIAAGMAEAAQEIGMNVTVDGISDGEMRFSVRDSDGRLIDASGIGMTVDPTGWDMTVPVLSGGLMTLVACGGLFLIGIRSIKQEATDG